MASGEFRVVHGEEPRCEALAESLSAWVDGALEPLARQEVEAHLRACPACAAQLAELERLAGELKGLVKVQPPPEVWDRIRAGSGTRARRGLAALVSEILIAPFDGELAQRVRETGTCREGERSPHGRLALLMGALLAVHALTAASSLSLMTAALGALLLWLGSTRLESRLSAQGMLGTLLLGALGPCAWEVARHSAGASFAPFGLSAAVAALSVAQCMSFPRLRPRVLGGLQVPCLARTAAMVLLAAGVARPDIVGPLAVVPPIAGAAAGALATWVQLPGRRAA